MKKLTYWRIPHTTNLDAHDIITKTKEEALRLAKTYWTKVDYDIERIEKITVISNEIFKISERVKS